MDSKDRRQGTEAWTRNLTAIIQLEDQGFVALREKLKEEAFSMPAPLIVSDPNVMMGKPVIAGTRITVELVLEELAAGTSVDELIAGHPALTPEAVSAALKFAAGALRVDTVYPAPRQSA